MPATLSRRRRHDYVRRRHAAGRTSTPLQRYGVFATSPRSRPSFFSSLTPCPLSFGEGHGVRLSIHLLIKLTIFRPRESFLSGEGLSCSDFCENKRIFISSRQSRNCKISPLRHAKAALFSQCFSAFFFCHLRLSTGQKRRDDLDKSPR